MSKRCNKQSFCKLLFRGLYALFILLPAEPAFAVQQHGGAEGLISHQIGHILFIIGMTYLLFRVYHNRIIGPGWFEFKCFLWLIILWNLLTFSGHWMREIVAPARFIHEGTQLTGFLITDTFDAVFYLTRFDHILLVASFLFLLAALQKWRRMR